MSGKLKALDVERETKPGKYADGGGLDLIVAGPTSKKLLWLAWLDSLKAFGFGGRARVHAMASA